ncbi:hypothetical protein BDZ45DRAFT_302813 [Acephala macrosclerotiorum]|nr:hypothetical protein BDZ45DRAFT_302813 [Acephala macrosclerotiorum]
MLFPVDHRQVRLYRPLLVRNLPSIKMPTCDECKGDGYKDGYICTSCKGKGTVEALAQSRRTVRSFNDEVQCDIYDGDDPALPSIMSTTSIFTSVPPVTPYRAEVEMDVALFFT